MQILAVYAVEIKIALALALFAAADVFSGFLDGVKAFLGTVIAHDACRAGFNVG